MYSWVGHLRCQPIGAARLRCHYSALTFLFRKTLGQPEKVAFISMPRAEAPPPIVPRPEEVQRVLESFTHAKYRTFFALIYATGLRIREASQVEIGDIDIAQQVMLGLSRFLVRDIDNNLAEDAFSALFQSPMRFGNQRERERARNKGFDASTLD